MKEELSRLENLIGKESLDILSTKKVAIFGLGGVGGYVVEGLVRSGINHFFLVDKDVVDISNINRQIIATQSSIGKDKTELMKDRILSINPEADIEIRKEFYLPGNADSFDLSKFDYVIDAIDTVSSKIELIKRCHELNVPIISALGAGNKLNPSELLISDISKTEYDPLAKVVRRELRKLGINHVKVAFSKEKSLIKGVDKDENRRKATPASAIFVPASMGLLIASEVIKDFLSYGK